jgi:exopolysaccharide production protein ExoZ
MTSANRDLHGLQILRGIAALAVIVHHTLEVSNGSQAGRFSPDWITTFGAAGVDLFFVISGFIMVYVSFPPDRSPDTPRGFLVKRATRIFPLYWICTAAFAAILAVGLLRNKHVDSYTILNSSFLLPGDKLVDVAWTLSFEVYFYMAFAMCLLFGKVLKTSISTIAKMVAGMVIGRVIQDSTFARFISSPLVLEFCFGIVLALMFTAGGKWKVPPAIGVFGFVIIMVSPIFVHHPTTAGLPDASRVLAWGLPATLVVASFLDVRRPQSMAGRAAILLGDASYALYLTHVFVMIGYGWIIKSTFAGDMPQMAFVPAIIVICIATGVLAHLLVEKPVLDLVRKAMKPRTERSPPLEVGDLLPSPQPYWQPEASDGNDRQILNLPWHAPLPGSPAPRRGRT